MGLVRLTSPQIVRIFGWRDYHPMLTWADVQNFSHISFTFLLDQGLSTQQLFRLQYDPHAWVQHGNLQLHDCLQMTQWPLHPIKHLRADLADVLRMQWTSDEMIKVGLTMTDLLTLGMTPTVMSKFGFTLNCWVSLGMLRMHLIDWTDQDMHCVFKMTRHNVFASCP
jgi:hypothetical protein